MSRRGTWGNCPLCNFPLDSSEISVCPNCRRDIVWKDGGWKSLEKERQDQEKLAAQGAAAAVIAGFLLVFAFKLIVWIFKFIKKKPKTAFVLIIISFAVGYNIWNNTAPRQFARAEQLLQSESSCAEGVTLLKSASDKEYEPAMIRYAEILLKGEYGVAVDKETAMSLLSQLSHNAQARFVLGQLYEDGVGGEKDYAKARENYLFAMNNGIDEAQEKCIKTTVLAWLTAIYDGNTQELNKLTTSDMSNFVSYYGKNVKERASLLKEIERFRNVNIQMVNERQAIVSAKDNPNIKIILSRHSSEWLVDSVGE